MYSRSNEKPKHLYNLECRYLIVYVFITAENCRSYVSAKPVGYNLVVFEIE
jgi:hypothetical protein